MLRLGRLRAAGENGGEERGNGEGKEARGSLLPTYPSAGKRRGAGENVGAGLRLAVPVAVEGKREEAVGGRKGMTGGPGLSAGERGERRRWPAGLRPRKEGEAPGWALQAERM